MLPTFIHKFSLQLITDTVLAIRFFFWSQGEWARPKPCGHQNDNPVPCTVYDRRIQYWTSNKKEKDPILEPNELCLWPNCSPTTHLKTVQVCGRHDPKNG